MKRLLLAALLAAPAFAQDLNTITQTSYGFITAQDGGSCAATSCVWLTGPLNTSSVVFQLSGTFSATVTFEASATGAVWSSIGTGSTAGSYPFSLSGQRFVRARATAYTSGTARVDVAALVGVGPAGPAGAAGPTVTSAALRLEDDFPSQYQVTGLLGWRVLSGSAANVAAVAGHPGIYSGTTGTTIGNGAGIGMTGTFAPPIFSLGTTSEFTSWSNEWIVNVDNGAGVGALSADSVGFCVGFTDNSGTDCESYGGTVTTIMVMADSPAPITCTSGTWSTTNWNYIATSGGARVCVDSGLPANTGTWYHMKISSTTLGTVVFSINGGNTGTISTSVPNFSPYPFIGAHTHAAAAKTWWLDYFNFLGSGLTR